MRQFTYYWGGGGGGGSFECFHSVAQGTGIKRCLNTNILHSLFKSYDLSALHNGCPSYESKRSVD